MITEKPNHREKGFALISVLALLVVSSLLVASAVTLTQYLTAEVDVFDSINRSIYAAESAVNRTIALLAQDRILYPVRVLGDDSTASDSRERFLADGRVHNFDVYGQKVCIQIFDAVQGIDVSGTSPGRHLFFSQADPGENEQLQILANRLNDYVDADDFVRESSFEAQAYNNLNLFHLPRNQKIQFREELRWIPGFKEHYPVSADGYWRSFRLIAPEKLKTLSGRPNLYSTPPAVLIKRCGLSKEEAKQLENALQLWQCKGQKLSHSLPETVYAKLRSYFSNMESGIYTIQVFGEKDSFGANLAVTLLIDSSKAKMEFYEYAYF